MSLRRMPPVVPGRVAEGGAQGGEFSRPEGLLGEPGDPEKEHLRALEELARDAQRARSVRGGARSGSPAAPPGRGEASRPPTPPSRPSRARRLRRASHPAPDQALHVPRKQVQSVVLTPSGLSEGCNRACQGLRRGSQPPPARGSGTAKSTRTPGSRAGAPQAAPPPPRRSAAAPPQGLCSGGPRTAQGPRRRPSRPPRPPPR
jgi:hypothetical protein